MSKGTRCTGISDHPMKMQRQDKTSRQGTIGQSSTGGDRSFPDPFPEGWYFVATRRSILANALIQKEWLGEDIVAWYDNAGSVCVAQSICPHLGSSLGPDAGGVVRDGCLVCPFHGFAYDATGSCVSTPYAPPPRTARLNVHPSREILGLVFAWWGHDGRPPQWHLPNEPPGEGDWSDLEIRTIRFAGHPQETTENAVDLGHLRYVHGYDEVNPIESATVNGAHLLSRFDFRRRRTIFRFHELVYRVSATVNVHGLGYSFVHIREHTIGLVSRLWVLATPVDGKVIDMVLVSQVQDLRKPKRLVSGLGFLPVKLRTRLMNKILITSQQRDVQQDVVIWERKLYRPDPALCHSDGPIGRYRRYCRQFYPSARNGGNL